MLLYRLARALAAAVAIAHFAATVPAAAVASVIPRQEGGSVTIQSISFYIMDHIGSDGGEEGTYPPFVNYDTTIQLGELEAECNNFTYSPMDATGGPDCPGVPARVDGVPTESCPPPGSFDGLEGVTWSITRYGDRFVQQVNVPDPDHPDTVYVACYEFDTASFQCNPDLDFQFQAVQDSPYTMNLTATVGQVCPSY